MAKRKFIVVVGASAGGSLVLPDLVQQLKPDMDISVFIVLHLSKRSIGDMLAERLQKHTSLVCKIPRHNETIKSGFIYVAEPDRHMMVKGNKILMGKGPMENRYRPSIDALFRSAAVTYKSSAIGIILSGLLEDGVAGMMAIRQSGGTCIIQDPAEAKYADMPRSVLKNLKPDFTISVQGMGQAIERTLTRREKKTKIPVELVKEAQIAERVNIGIEHVQELGTNSLFSCPDCGGGLWEIDHGGEKTYRCHVGHAFSEQGLLGAMESTTETALWTALRIIEERRNLLKAISTKENGSKAVRGHYKKRMVELDQQIEQLKKVLFATEGK
jgi:two-component system, chemotaxis family, protein-glutamate methylesterase/glutaminase